jgi:hypothetical protein
LPTVSTVQALYARWITELWAGRPVAAEIVTDDFVGHWPGRDAHGPQELQRIVEETRNMIADFTFAIELGPLSEGDLVAARWVARAAGRTARSPSPATTSSASTATVNASRSTGPAPRRAEVPEPSRRAGAAVISVVDAHRDRSGLFGRLSSGRGSRGRA